jgi:hypothetical protein
MLETTGIYSTNNNKYSQLPPVQALRFPLPGLSLVPVLITPDDPPFVEQALRSLETQGMLVALPTRPPPQDGTHATAVQVPLPARPTAPPAKRPAAADGPTQGYVTQQSCVRSHALTHSFSLAGSALERLRALEQAAIACDLARLTRSDSSAKPADSHPEA